MILIDVLNNLNSLNFFNQSAGLLSSIIDVRGKVKSKGKAERAPQSDIRPGKAKIRFDKLLHAVAQIHGCGAKDLTAAGRRRAWAKRTQFAYPARDWCGMKAIEVARRLNRAASMVSRLCAEYEIVRNAKTGKRLLNGLT